MEDPVPVFLWFLLAMLSAVAEISRGLSSINNYEIFAGVFHHTIRQTNLYAEYPVNISTPIIMARCSVS
jgi:hypothetical protein